VGALQLWGRPQVVGALQLWGRPQGSEGSPCRCIAYGPDADYEVWRRHAAEEAEAYAEDPGGDGLGGEEGAADEWLGQQAHADEEL
jgi:hypothetical protein